MIITEDFCDKAFELIKFNKNNMQSVIATIRTSWVSTLFTYNRSEASIVENILDTIFRLMYNRRLWQSLDIYTKKNILGFLYRNKRLFLDSKALNWKDIDTYDTFQRIGNSHWDVNLK